jgi:hypothetical protein
MALHTLRRFLKLNNWERGIVLGAAAGLVTTRVGLRVLGFRRWEKVLEGLTPAVPPQAGRAAATSGDFEKARRVARLQASAERHLFFRPSCLEHSLVLRWMLARHGVAANLRFGGRKEQSRFEAHAWVEVGGVALDELSGEQSNFVPFDAANASMETQVR